MKTLQRWFVTIASQPLKVHLPWQQPRYVITAQQELTCVCGYQYMCLLSFLVFHVSLSSLSDTFVSAHLVYLWGRIVSLISRLQDCSTHPNSVRSQCFSTALSSICYLLMARILELKGFHLLAVMKHWSVDPRVEGSSRREKKPALFKK